MRAHHHVSQSTSIPSHATNGQSNTRSLPYPYLGNVGASIIFFEQSRLVALEDTMSKVAHFDTFVVPSLVISKVFSVRSVHPSACQSSI
jgi:hypothetical protein